MNRQMDLTPWVSTKSERLSVLCHKNLTVQFWYPHTCFLKSSLWQTISVFSITGGCCLRGSLDELKQKAASQGYPTDNLEDTFLTLIDADNRQRGGAR